MTTTEPTLEAVEELARVLGEKLKAAKDKKAHLITGGGWFNLSAEEVARAVLAAGYVKPRPFEVGDRVFDRGSIVPTEEERADSRDELLRIFARQNQPTGELRKTTLDGTERLSGTLVDAIIDSGWENAELLALRENLATLLTRTANALKGDPPALTSWSWHDLPEVAADLRAALESGS